jgi:hypothetical protein
MNEIHDEIRRTRDARIRACGGDVGNLMDYYRERQSRRAASGCPVVSFVGETPRELPRMTEEEWLRPTGNEIIDEIHRHRAEFGRECEYDVRVMSERHREHAGRLKAEGWKVASPAVAQEPSAIVREEPLKE